ncbi:diiron oxygenase [Actinomadura darangshiensis]|uniref:diiron oxygenase n=1 Tax=Actinomadura darangshiensis TaxID=705336 RepID=UPI001FB6D0E4|nr:diiron oxygenase [Actinomadura darangshiensis]
MKRLVAEIPAVRRRMAKLARRVAARDPHRRATMAWSFRKCTAFFDEIGFLDGRARDVWVRAGLLER